MENFHRRETHPLKDSAMLGINMDVHGFCVHALRATAATNALAHNADIAKVQEWLGHANIATTRLYDRRQSRSMFGMRAKTGHSDYRPEK
jgi:site-specific recombinase XerD